MNNNVQDSNDTTDSKQQSLTDLLTTFSQLRLQSQRKTVEIEQGVKELRRINRDLEIAATAIQEFTEERVLVHSTELDIDSEPKHKLRQRQYKALIPKRRVQYEKYYDLQALAKAPQQGTLVVILNKYRSTIDDLQQQGVIGVVKWIDWKHIGVTVTDKRTYKKAWSSCAEISPRAIEYEKEYPVSKELWEKLMK